MGARSRFLLGPLVAAAMLLVACGGDDDTTAAASSAPAEATTSESAAADPCASTEGGPGTPVTVSERGFNPIELDATSVEAGTVTFVVTSYQGPATHELVVLGTVLAPNKLPLTGDGTAADERGPGVTLMGKTDSIAPGCAASLTVDLERGDYVLICNLPGPPGGMGHYESGMVAPTFTVT